MSAVSCAAPRCTDPAGDFVDWLPFCEAHTYVALEHPEAIAALHPPRAYTPAMEARISAAEDQADSKAWDVQ